MLHRTSDIVFICLPRGLRGVAMLALLRSSHSHICLGNGYAVVQVHILIMREMREGHFRVLLKNSFSMSLADFFPSSGRSRERLKIKSLEKIFIPSLGRQREGRKINPPRKIFCFGSKLEPFSYAGLLVAPKWSHFSSMASKVMLCPLRSSSVWQQN